MGTIDFEVTGMHCDGCARRLEKVLLKKDGISEAKASFADNSCVVTADEKLIDRDSIVAAIEGANFQVEGVRS